VTAQLEGIYNMEIYYEPYSTNRCSKQEYFIAKYLIHATLAAMPVRFDETWQGNGRWLAMWVHDGRLFWTYRSNTRYIYLPPGVTAAIEVVDDAGNAFVGTVTVTEPTPISPNASVPFMARITITLDQPRAFSFVRGLTDFGGFVYGATVQAVDDYTVEIIIVKTGPGLSALAALAIMAIAAFCVWMLYDVRVREINASVEIKRLETVEPLVKRYTAILDKYIEEISKAKSEQEVKNVQAKYLGALQTTAALVGQVYASGIGRCDGVKIGETCVPWWVIGIGIFVAGLMVVSVLK